jgi:hypothetical protein
VRMATAKPDMPVDNLRSLRRPSIYPTYRHRGAMILVYSALPPVSSDGGGRAYTRLLEAVTAVGAASVTAHLDATAWIHGWCAHRLARPCKPL